MNLSLNFSSQRISSLDVLSSVSEPINNDEVKHIDVSSNLLPELSLPIATFRFVEYLNASNNEINLLTPEIRQLVFLRILDLRNNKIDINSIPYEFCELENLQELNLSGNNLDEIPLPVLKLKSLVSLYLGGNQIAKISEEVDRLVRLRVLYLGGNVIETLPDQIANLPSLEVLSLSANRLRYLPTSFGNFRRLRSLMLNDNLLQCLPFDITRLRLEELSLRNNPLLANFVADYHHEVPTLQELTARCIKAYDIGYDGILPSCLVAFLDSGKNCVNPRCKGVYFCSRVSNMKFIDLCGKYQVPMLQYLCSPRCMRSRPNSPVRVTNPEVAAIPEQRRSPELNQKLKKVLLG